MPDPTKPSRRRFVTWASVAAAAGGLNASEVLGADPPPDAGGGRRAGARTADEALAELLAGNARFAEGQPTSPRRTPADFRELAEGQAPFAVIVGCADSRVAPEILFDVGKGDVFIVRVAGNVIHGAGPVIKGSIEYAVAELNVPLVMVLGHSKCGAVKAAMAHLEAKDSLPGAINDLVELIKPAVAESKGDAGDPLDNAIRRNVLLGVERLRKLEPIVGPRVKQGALRIAGGVYDLKTGKVEVIA